MFRAFPFENTPLGPYSPSCDSSSPLECPAQIFQGCASTSPSHRCLSVSPHAPETALTQGTAGLQINPSATHSPSSLIFQSLPHLSFWVIPLAWGLLPASAPELGSSPCSYHVTAPCSIELSWVCRPIGFSLRGGCTWDSEMASWLLHAAGCGDTCV